MSNYTAPRSELLGLRCCSRLLDAKDHAAEPCPHHVQEKVPTITCALLCFDIGSILCQVYVMVLSIFKEAALNQFLIHITLQLSFHHR